MEQYLAEHPGGVPLNSNEISYGGGAFVVELAPPLHLVAAPDCPWGWFCFYERPNYGYPRGKLSDCGWQKLATWNWQFRVESAYYHMDQGTAKFYYKTAYHTYYLFEVGVGNRALPRTGFPNLANMVNRVYC